MSNFAGKVALVTGAGSGIGRAVAERFAASGAQVVVADLDEVAATAVASGIGDAAIAVQADVSRAGDVATMVRAAVDAFGGIDCACNNAGIAPAPKPFTEHTLDEWARTIDVNLTGVFLCMQEQIRHWLGARRNGVIVNMSSGAGVVPAPGQPQYTAAKHGVLGITKQAAQEFARQGIRVNAVLPGQTDTPPMREYLEASGMGDRMVKMLPMGRMATPDEVAAAVLWLCSDEASYVNGVSLLVDGGLLAR